MLTLFEMSTTEGWPTVMWSGVDAVGVGQQVRPNVQGPSAAAAAAALMMPAIAMLELADRCAVSVCSRC